MSTRNLQAHEANSKIKELAESINFSILCTDLSNLPFHAIPMSTKRVDGDGAIWFLSGQDSTHNANIIRNPAVSVLYSDTSSMRFLTIFGQALVLTENSILKSLYTKMDDTWFTGLDDPSLSSIKVIPHSAHYWEVKGNRLSAIWKMAVSSFTGTDVDFAEHGDLKV